MTTKAEIEISAKDKTRAALQAAETNLAKLDKGVATLTKAFGALVGAGALGAVIKKSLDVADAIAKAADAADIGVGTLQELRFAAEQTGVSTAQLDDGMRRFARRLGLAADGAGPAAKAYENLGISVLGADGKIRGTEFVLNDVIKTLGDLESNAERAALASAFFGDDAGPKLALLLKQGEDGINALRQEARDLGIVLDEDMVRNAERAGDQMQKLESILTMKVTKAVVDNAAAIEKLVDGLIYLVDKLGDGITALNDFGYALGERIAIMTGSGEVARIKQLQMAIEQLQGTIAVRNKMGFLYPDFLKSIDEKNLATMQAKLDAMIASRTSGGLDNPLAPAAASAPSAAADTPRGGGGGGIDSRLQGPPITDELSAFGESQAKLQEKMQQRLDSVALQLMTEEQRLSESYINRQMIVNEAFNNDLIEEERRKELLLQLEEQYQDKLKGIQQQGMSAQQILWEQNWQGKLQVMSGVMGQLANLMQSGNKKQFEIGKKAAIAQSLINTFQMATASYNALAGIPIVGPALGAAAAYAAVQYGKSQVDAIKSQQFGGGSGAVGTFPASPNTGLPADSPGGGGVGNLSGLPQAQQTQPTRIVNITLAGNSYTRDDVRDLIEQINREADNGMEVRTAYS